MSEKEKKSLKDTAPITAIKNDGVPTRESKSIDIKKTAYSLLSVSSILLLILLWVYISTQRPDMFPTPAMCYERLIRLFTNPVSNNNLFGHILASLKRVLTALIISIVLGVSFGILIGWDQRANALFGTIFEILRPIPPLAWIPLVIMWFGVSEFGKVLIVFIGTFMPIVINTSTGIRLVDEQNINVGRIFKATESQMLFEIAIPSAMPAIFAGIRASTSAGWMTVLAAEMLGAKSGLGFLITRGMESDDTALIFVSIITIGLVGALLAVMTANIERRLCPWLKHLD